MVLSDGHVDAITAILYLLYDDEDVAALWQHIAILLIVHLMPCVIQNGYNRRLTSIRVVWRKSHRCRSASLCL